MTQRALDDSNSEAREFSQNAEFEGNRTEVTQNWLNSSGKLTQYFMLCKEKGIFSSLDVLFSFWHKSKNTACYSENGSG